MLRDSAAVCLKGGSRACVTTPLRVTTQLRRGGSINLPRVCLGKGASFRAAELRASAL